MFIQTESTPNPATLKFLPGQTVLEAGTADFPNADAAGSSPLAQRVFAVNGVTGVFFGNDFVTVTKAERVEWEHVKPAILGAIMEHLQSGQPAIADDSGLEVDALNGETGHQQQSGGQPPCRQCGTSVAILSGEFNLPGCWQPPGDIRSGHERW